MYGLVREIPQKETTPFYPRSPYGKIIGISNRIQRYTELHGFLQIIPSNIILNSVF